MSGRGLLFRHKYERLCLRAQASVQLRDAEIARLAAEVQRRSSHIDEAAVQRRAETHETIILQLHGQVPDLPHACAHATSASGLGLTCSSMLMSCHSLATHAQLGCVHDGAR